MRSPLNQHAATSREDFGRGAALIYMDAEGSWCMAFLERSKRSGLTEIVIKQRGKEVYRAIGNVEQYDQILADPRLFQQHPTSTAH